MVNEQERQSFKNLYFINILKRVWHKNIPVMSISTIKEIITGVHFEDIFFFNQMNLVLLYCGAGELWNIREISKTICYWLEDE